MSHLQRPRIHFVGEFVTDPSTANNYPDSYDPGAPLVTGWNHNGLHLFRLRNCRVTRALHHGGVATTSSADALVDAAVATTDDPSPAKMVDLDPRYQTGTEVWCLALRVAVGGIAAISGRVRTAFLHDLWFERAPGDLGGASGSFYGVIDQLSFGAVSSSPTLEALRPMTTLSLKFTVYAFDPPSRTGKLVGTIGPGSTDRVNGWVGRRLTDDSGDPQVFGAAEAELDVARSRLTIDLSNAIPEASIGGSRIDLGQLTAHAIALQPPLLTPGPVLLGPLDYSRTRLLRTAGVEEIDLQPAQLQAARNGPLTLVDNRLNRQILGERPDGLAAAARIPVVRMQPGTTTPVTIHVTRFGQPAASVTLQAVTVPSAMSRTGGLTVPGPPASPTTLSTNSNGIATLNLGAAQPSPIPGDHIDGEVYEIGIHVGSAGPSDRLTTIYVRVFDAFTEPAAPTWSDVRPILAQYQRLYPGMSARMPGGGLGSHATYQNPGYRTVVAMYLRYAIHDSRHMPVTRDLSEAKRRTILLWLDRGAP